MSICNGKNYERATNNSQQLTDSNLKQTVGRCFVPGHASRDQPNGKDVCSRHISEA